MISCSVNDDSLMGQRIRVYRMDADLRPPAWQVHSASTPCSIKANTELTLAGGRSCCLGSTDALLPLAPSAQRRSPSTAVPFAEEHSAHTSQTTCTARTIVIAAAAAGHAAPEIVSIFQAASITVIPPSFRACREISSSEVVPEKISRLRSR